MANSKLLLIQDVEDLGRSGDIVTVKPGYSRNFLVPNKLAVVASPHALKMQARLQEERLKRAAQDKQDAERVAASMEGLTVTTTAKVDHEGHMYGSVSASDIAALIHAQTGLTVEKRAIQLKHALKAVGIFEIPLKLKEGIVASVKVQIDAEEVQ